MVHEDDSGATAVEYALMVSLIAVVIIGAVIVFGSSLDASFRDSCAQLFSSC